MNVIRLWGGLGNQLFQYALGRRIAVHTRTPVKFDAENGFRHDSFCRRFALDVFNTEIVPAVTREIPLGMSWRSPWHRLAKLGWGVQPSARRRVVYETEPFRFAPTVLAARKSSAYYFGYWQNEGYFEPIRATLQRDFTLRSGVRPPMAELVAEMAGCRAVSMHVRRYRDLGADGRLIATAQAHHGACGAEYFQKALSLIGAEPGTVCFVFSDDLPWAKANLKMPVPCRYVDALGPFSDAEELLLMASCQHHVISNSSFSWWGAWLGGNPAKKVVAPRIWLRHDPELAADVCPRTWTRI